MEYQNYSNGILLTGDAAGFALNMGVTVRGMELQWPQVLWQLNNSSGKEVMIFEKSTPL